MNNNISNMGGINPANYNTQGKAQAPKEEVAPSEETLDKCCTDLECDPNCAIGRSQVKMPYKYNPQDTVEDVQMYEYMMEFADDIKGGLMQNEGLSEEEAAKRALEFTDYFFNKI